MSKVMSFIFIVAVLFSLSGCGSAPASAAGSDPASDAAPADSSSAKLNEGRTAAIAATEAMNRAEQGGASRTTTTTTTSSPAAASQPAKTGSSAVQTSGPRGEPGWVTIPYSVYKESEYVAASGSGANRTAAEKNALAALTAVFGQSIQADLKLMTSFSEAVKNGVVDVSESNSLQEAINTSTEMDSLVGAEIKDVWYDGKSVYYAVAAMERVKTAALYADMINANERIIKDLTTMSAAEKNTLDGYSRYQLAATIADTNRAYANVLSVVGKGTGSVVPANLKKGDDYRLEAANLTKNIPIAVRVNGDRSDRIRGAFASVVSGAGFRSGGNSARYVLNVTLTLSEVQLGNQQNKFARYVVDANLTDTAEGTVLLPFNINGREGHLNLSEAENRAVATAERKIKETYGGILSEYLSTLLPTK
ncbi:MAG: LPP20 family lipoprotein [Treponema sp.]|nr:LPP20 family lipoprotein [Treponema sp.]